MTRYVRFGDAWVDVGGGVAAGGRQHPAAVLSDGSVSATSARSAVTCTASATPHSPGAWVEVDASLSADADAFVVLLTAATNTNGVNTSTLLEIGTGASGSESVWATVQVGFRAPSSPPIVVPGRIAAGTRVAVRARSAVASKTVTAIYSLHATSGLGAPITYQADTATSRGLTLPNPALLNTKGAWAEVVASTASDLAALCLTFGTAGGSAITSGGSYLVDVGIGPAGSETVLLGDLHVYGSTLEELYLSGLTTFTVDLPAGTRIAARAQRNNNSLDIDLIAIGAPPA